MENTEISDEENERISSMSSWNEPLACFEKLNEIYEERLTMAKGETGSDVTEVINTNFSILFKYLFLKNILFVLVTTYGRR